MQPEAPGLARLFVALTAPDPVMDALAEVQQRLRRLLAEAQAKWATRDQFHLTLRFLGNVETNRIEPLVDALRKACHSFAPLPLRASGLGCFPKAHAPRVIWVGVNDPENRLAALQRAVEDACRGFTVQPPERSFTGHLTLARIKSIRRPEIDRLAEARTEMGQRSLGDWTAREVELIQSRLFPQGAEYTALASVPLGAAPGDGGQF